MASCKESSGKVQRAGLGPGMAASFPCRAFWGVHLPLPKVCRIRDVNCETDHLGRPCSEHGAEVLEGSPKPDAAVDGGVPAQECLCLCDVGPAALGIVLGQVVVDDLALRALDQGDNLKSELMHGDLGRVPQIHWQGMVDVEQPVNALHQVAHVAEAARLV